MISPCFPGILRSSQCLPVPPQSLQGTRRTQRAWRPRRRSSWAQPAGAALRPWWRQSRWCGLTGCPKLRCSSWSPQLRHMGYGLWGGLGALDILEAVQYGYINLFKITWQTWHLGIVAWFSDLVCRGNMGKCCEHPWPPCDFEHLPCGLKFEHRCFYQTSSMALCAAYHSFGTLRNMLEILNLPTWKTLKHLIILIPRKVLPQVLS